MHLRTWHIETRDIDELKPHHKNPRYLSKEDARHLKKSITRFGLIDRPVITGENKVIGGHQRLEILKDMGYTTVECWVPDHDELSEDEIDELNIRLNKNQGSWDWDKLANEWDIQDLLDWGFEDDDFHDTTLKKKIPAVTYEFSDVEDLKSFMSQVENISCSNISKTKVKI